MKNTDGNTEEKKIELVNCEVPLDTPIILERSDDGKYIGYKRIDIELEVAKAVEAVNNPDSCYCVCHSEYSSCPSCEHCIRAVEVAVGAERKRLSVGFVEYVERWIERHSVTRNALICLGLIKRLMREYLADQKQEGESDE